MKKLMMMAVMMVMTISANAMSYSAAKNEALFLSDKMAYELNLTDAQYEAVYEINLDYLMSVDSRADVFGIWWERRNADLRYVLDAWQYDRYVSLSYFYRPMAWNAGNWTFAVYTHYDRGRFFKARPTVFVSYRGGNNRRDAHFYADRHVTKPAVNSGNRTWRNTNVTNVTVNVNNGRNRNANVGHNGNDRIGSNREVAQANTSNRSNRNGHFGGRR